MASSFFQAIFLYYLLFAVVALWSFIFPPNIYFFLRIYINTAGCVMFCVLCLFSDTLLNVSDEINSRHLTTRTFSGVRLWLWIYEEKKQFFKKPFETKAIKHWEKFLFRYTLTSHKWCYVQRLIKERYLKEGYIIA